MRQPGRQERSTDVNRPARQWAGHFICGGVENSGERVQERKSAAMPMAAADGGYRREKSAAMPTVSSDGGYRRGKVLPYPHMR